MQVAKQTLRSEDHVKSKQGNAPFFSRNMVQAKLAVNEAGDSCEQEADRMADHIMQRNAGPDNENVFFKPAAPAVHRKILQRKEDPGNRVQGGNELDSYVGSLNSSGQALPESSRSFFEPRFAHDFSDVRIHSDSTAAKSAQSINALAYTTGNNIVFNTGQYSPDNENGKRLMAHELTHVVQQNHSQISPKTIQRQDDAPHASNLQITKRLELPAPADSLPAVESSPEHHDAEGAHLGVDLASGVSANPALSLTPQTYSFSLVCRDCNLYSGSDDAPISFDFIHEPNFQLSFSPDPHNAQIYQAAVSLVNIHFRRHRQEFIEVGLSPQLAYAQPSGTLTAGAQVQVEWHVTSRFSLTASSAISATKHDDSAPPDYGSVPLGTGHGLDWSWAPLSIGALVHFD